MGAHSPARVEEAKAAKENIQKHLPNKQHRHHDSRNRIRDDPIQKDQRQGSPLLTQKYQDSVSLIEDYTVLSKRFMGLMEKIGESVEQDRFKEVSQDVYHEISK